MELEQLRGLNFDAFDKIKKPRLRSRIKENFTIGQLQEFYDICLSNKFDNNNDKVDVIHHILHAIDFTELGSGTNRYASMKDNYVYKFSLDHYGFDDNWTEFNMCKELLKYGAVKTYESDGLITVAQCVNVLSLKEFRANRDKIRGILAWMAEDYLFADLGTVDKNFRNWGYDDDGNLVFLDYGSTFRPFM